MLFAVMLSRLDFSVAWYKITGVSPVVVASTAIAMLAVWFIWLSA